MPFPKELASAQRAAVANDLRDVCDLLEPFAGLVNELEPHLIDLDRRSFDEFVKLVSEAKRSLFYARQEIETR